MQFKLDLSQLSWQLSGWTPNLWQLCKSMETGGSQKAEIPAIPAQVPGSVQGALLRAGILNDPHVGFQARNCEWVENRHWMFQCEIPAVLPADSPCELVCPGLDTEGWVYWDNACLGRFCGAHRPHVFRLPENTAGHCTVHHLAIIFDSPIRFAGQFGRTWEIPVTKPRYYYTWDWIPRMVQIGITRAPWIRAVGATELDIIDLWTDAVAAEHRGVVFVKAKLRGAEEALLTLHREGRCVWSRKATAAELARGVREEISEIELWEPNLSGEQILYSFEIDAGDAGHELRSVGFKQIRWLPCRGSAPDAEPWLCEINGRATFLQGFNWTPLRAYYADCTRAHYELRLRHYREMGCNILRIWGGAFLEPDYFYDLCDEYGLLVWQEFPMSSSGLSNVPPHDEESIAEMRRIADAYLTILPRHVSLLAWSGGNELQRGPEGADEGCGFPCDIDEPILAMLAAVTKQRDPSRRFMATSASGPREFGDPALYGNGELWDVHGPWKCEGTLEEAWYPVWENDDSLFRSEFGCPGASGADLIRRYAGKEAYFPCSAETPLWNYPLPWWAEEYLFVQEHGRASATLEEYVTWSQERQSRALSYAMNAMKSRFPSIGGAIVWMGHDSFPCTANTSVIDFEGNLKPAAQALSEIFHRPAGCAPEKSGK